MCTSTPIEKASSYECSTDLILLMNLYHIFFIFYLILFFIDLFFLYEFSDVGMAILSILAREKDKK